jgi:hypothetical protein
MFLLLFIFRQLLKIRTNLWPFIGFNMSMCPHSIVGAQKVKKIGFLRCKDLPKVKVQENFIDEELAYLKPQFVIFCLNYMLLFEKTNSFMF